MSDYRDTIKSAIENGFYLDSCGSDERQYNWGRYIDLCGMDVKDAIPVSPCPCDGGGEESGKTKNTVTLLMAQNETGNYTLHLSPQYASTDEFNVSLTVDGTAYLITVPAGTTIYDTEITGENPEKPYATISDINIMSGSETYTYKPNNTVKTGLFKLTIIKDGEQSINSVKYDTEYELPYIEEKTGYDFVWRDEDGNVITGETYTMPEKDVTITGVYEVQKYALMYFIIEENYENNSLVTSTTSGSTILTYGANILNALNGLTPEKEGHTLTGWKFVSDGTAVLSSSTIPNSDIEVINTYKLNKYVLTYISNGETFETNEYYFMQPVIETQNTPEKEGYTFAGWNGIPSTMPSHNVTVNAIFNVNEYTLSYNVDGALYSSFTVAYGTAIVPIAEPSKEGYTFSGWDSVPATMPAHNVEVNGTFEINEYTLSYSVDGAPYTSFTLEYGAEIVPIAEPSKEGYTFSGWSEIPTTMPAHNVEVNGTFAVNEYTLLYNVDGEPYSSFTVTYGTAIVPIAEPSKEGYTFSGWDSVPSTMPAHNVEVNGTFSINQYTLSFFVDGEPYTSVTGDYNSAVPAVIPPSREGYTFSGWTNVPQTFPAENRSYDGYLIVNEHTLSYFVDDSIYSSFTVTYGTAIVPIAEPSKEGYTFSGWGQIPATMPDSDVRIDGHFTINQYILTFIVDSQPYTSVTGDFGSSVPQILTPEKQGYTFSGWDKQVPLTFPAENEVFNGTFNINSYVASYVIDGEPYSSVSYNYGATIIYPDIPKSGYTLNWDKVYETMPASSITITGEYIEISIPKIIYYDAVLTSTESGITNVSGMPSYEYEKNVETPLTFTIPGNPEYTIAEEELEEEEFEEWCEEHNYSLYFAAPVGISFTVTDGSGTDVTALTNPVGSILIINGNEYQGYAQHLNACCISTDISQIYNITFVN